MGADKHGGTPIQTGILFHFPGTKFDKRLGHAKLRGVGGVASSKATVYREFQFQGFIILLHAGRQSEVPRFLGVSMHLDLQNTNGGAARGTGEGECWLKLPRACLLPVRIWGFGVK